MKFTISSILYIVAVVLLLAAAFGINFGTIGLGSLGLAAIAGGLLLADWKM